jgi:hypothetical protein
MQEYTFRVAGVHEHSGIRGLWEVELHNDVLDLRMKAAMPSGMKVMTLNVTREDARKFQLMAANDETFAMLLPI